MATQTESVVCKNCGAEETKNTAGKHSADFDGCEKAPEGRITHDWSHPNPVARLMAKVNSTDGLTVTTHGDGDWMWVEVLVDEGRDAVGNSEVLSNYVKQEGFDFSGIGNLENSLRFNKKKQSR